MSSERRLTIDLGTGPFRIVTPDERFSRRVGERLGSRCAKSSDSEFQPILRFEIKAPAVSSSAPLFVLLGHSGRVLARLRSEEDALAVLESQLDSIATPLAEDVVRFHMQAIISPKGATLIDKRLTAGDKPFVERRLERLNAGVVDSPFIDVASNGRLRATGAVRQTTAGGDDTHTRYPLGHRSPGNLDEPVISVAVRGDGDSPIPRALLCAILARSAEGRDPVDVLDRSASLARDVEIAVGPHGAAHELLTHLVDGNRRSD